VGAALSLLSDIGFDAIHPVDAEQPDIVEIRRQWQGKMALVDGIATDLLIHGRRDEIEEKVRERCLQLAPGGGYVLSSGRGLNDGVPPESFVIMARAVHRFGRYGALGVAARL
jgi:uroporphyrinogen-III decarboxylase